MPAPDPTAPEVKALLHEGYSLDELRTELAHQESRLVDEASGFDDDARHIVTTWINALKGEIERRTAA